MLNDTLSPKFFEINKIHVPFFTTAKLKFKERK